MATIIKEFPSTRVRATKYPYADWFDGNTWELTAKEGDFDVPVASFRGAISAAAKRNGFKVRTAITEDGNGVVIQAVPLKGHTPTNGVKAVTKPKHSSTPVETSVKTPTEAPVLMVVQPTAEQAKTAKELAE